MLEDAEQGGGSSDEAGEEEGVLLGKGLEVSLQALMGHVFGVLRREFIHFAFSQVHPGCSWRTHWRK